MFALASLNGPVIASGIPIEVITLAARSDLAMALRCLALRQLMTTWDEDTLKVWAALAPCGNC